MMHCTSLYSPIPYSGHGTSLDRHLSWPWDGGPHVTITHDANSQSEVMWGLHPLLSGPSPGIPALIIQSPPPDMFKLVQLGPHHTRTRPRHGKSY